MRSISIPKIKKDEANILPSCPNELGQKMIFLYGFTVNDGEQVTGIFCVHKVVNLS